MVGITFFLAVLVSARFQAVIAGRVITDGTLHVAMSSPWTGPYTAGRELSCGFIVGLETVKERQLLPGYEVKYQVGVFLSFSKPKRHLIR